MSRIERKETERVSGRCTCDCTKVPRMTTADEERRRKCPGTRTHRRLSFMYYLVCVHSRRKAKNRRICSRFGIPSRALYTRFCSSSYGALHITIFSVLFFVQKSENTAKKWSLLRNGRHHQETVFSMRTSLLCTRNRSA